MMEKKKLQVWLPLLLGASMALGVFFGFKMRDGFPGKSFFYTQKRNPLQEVVDLINRKYVDTINNQMLADTAIAAILSKLDPHSAFIPASELEEANEDINGNFVGIGIEYNIIQDTIHVVNVFKEGPAEKNGIQVGDRIIKVNDSALTGKKISTKLIRNLMRGPQGSNIQMSLISNGKLKQLTIQRGSIPLYTVEAAYMIDTAVGYIKLTGFSKQTYREFMLALEKLKKLKLKKLILDLRGNGGGVLDEAVEIADEFLTGDKLITYTEGLHVKKKEFRCRRIGQWETAPLVVLADEGTASASEVLLGALQDWDRATIIGRRSFGKGLVQEQFNISGGSALRLTVARYYTPVGRSIQRPYTKGKKAYYSEVSNRFTNGGVLSPDSIKNDSTQIYYTKKGKKIYGGGGISPDVFIAADSNRLDSSNTKLWHQGYIGDYGYLYLMQNPGLRNNFTTPAQYSNEFIINDQAWNYFEQMLLKDSVRLQNMNPGRKKYLSRLLKASVARILFRTEGFYQALNLDDRVVLKAMEVLQH